MTTAPEVLHLGSAATVPRPAPSFRLSNDRTAAPERFAANTPLDHPVPAVGAAKQQSVLVASVSSAGGVLTNFVNERGMPVRIETFRPAWMGGPVPGVLVLHGASGLNASATYYDAARLLADNGYAAFVVHYFDADGTARPKPHLSPVTRSDRESAILDAIAHISRLPYVDPSRIALLGVSLGSFHALAVASRDKRVGAVINFVGGLSRADPIDRMPPTLILHGDRDRVVPVTRAYDLAAELRRIGGIFEMHIYGGEGHAFRGGAQADSRERMLSFLARYLDGTADENREVARAAKWPPR